MSCATVELAVWEFIFRNKQPNYTLVFSSTYTTGVGRRAIVECSSLAQVNPKASQFLVSVHRNRLYNYTVTLSALVDLVVKSVLKKRQL